TLAFKFCRYIRSRLILLTFLSLTSDHYHHYFGEAKKFELYNDSEVKQRVEQRGGHSLDFPDLADRVADDLNGQRLTIRAVLKTLPLGNRAELTRWRGVVARMLAPILRDE
ncbi:MAG TPA: hypothetical protein VES89_00975, partial [Candidatus Competibacteraceae bacterium]|nr:hypothetical protein [Candidatus Competibacteraceae bacterium]